MKGELPACKRCCCCFPLRYGLLVWGYFKMTADVLIIALMSYLLILTVMTIKNYYKSDDDFLTRFYEESIILCVFLVVFLADLVVTILFIIGGHKKNVKLIKVFYYVSIAMWIFSTLLAATYITLVIINSINWQRNIITFSFYFVVLVVQTYFLILLRSEIIKLENIGEFRFVNNAAEAQCTMTCEEIVAEEGTGRTDV